MTKVLAIGVIIIPMVLVLGTLSVNMLTDTQTNAENLKNKRDSLFEQVTEYEGCGFFC